MGVTEHVLPHTLIVQASVLVPAPHSNWVVAGLRTVEILEGFTVTVARRVVPVEPLCLTVATAGDASGVLYGAAWAEEANTVVVTGPISLLTLLAH